MSLAMLQNDYIKKIIDKNQNSKGDKISGGHFQ